MPLVTTSNTEIIDHLAAIFANARPVTISHGEIERLRAIERELRAIKETIGESPLGQTLIQGAVLAPVFDLL